MFDIMTPQKIKGAIIVSYIAGVNRDQVVLFPEAIDDYITPDNPVRFIDAFVDGDPEEGRPANRGGSRELALDCEEAA